MVDRPRIAILAPWLVDNYTRSVVDGALEPILAAGAGAICVTGQRLIEAGVNSAAFTAFDLIREHPIDAFIVVAGTLVDDPTALPAFYETFRPRPVVSAGLRVDGYPSVTVDNEPGLRAAIEHVIVEHGRRRIAFVAGPANHPEAKARMRAYRAALEAGGIPFDPTLVVPGNFWEGSGRIGVKTLLDDRKVAFDAFVGTNDGIAIMALRELSGRGIGVPDDVSIIGYDGDPMSAFAVPPLTTVRQPIRELGARAATLALEMLRGGRVAPETILPTEPIIRQSCGCFRASAPPPFPTDAMPDVDSARERARSALAALAPTAITPEHCLALLDAFTSDVSQTSSSHFLSLSERIVQLSDNRGPVLRALGTVVEILRRELVPSVAQKGAWAAFAAEGLLHRVRERMASALTLEPARCVSEAEVAALRLTELSQFLASGGHDLPTFVLELRERLAPLGVGCAVSTLVDASTAKLLVDVGRSGEGRAYPDGLPFEARMLGPEGTFPTDGPFCRVLMPLEHRTRRLGFVLFDAPIGASSLMTALQIQISSGLMRLDHEQQLARLHAEQKARTSELERANALLEQDVDRLIVSEKMASLGRLTAGIAHEMNSPLAAIRASLDEIAMLARELREAADDPESTPKDRDEIAAELAETLGVSGNACERLAQFLRSIKLQTRDTGKASDVFDVVDMTRQALLLLGHDARETACTFDVQAEPARIDILGSTARLTQVVEALAHNALDASRSKGGSRIDIRIRDLGDDVTIQMQDCGSGIAPENLHRVFDPLFSTKPFGEAAGLGLTIAHDIIVGDFGGRIELRSEAGKGTTVSIVIPKRQSARNASPRPRRSMRPPP